MKPYIYEFTRGCKFDFHEIDPQNPDHVRIMAEAGWAPKSNTVEYLMGRLAELQAKIENAELKAHIEAAEYGELQAKIENAELKAHIEAAEYGVSDLRVIYPAWRNAQEAREALGYPPPQDTPATLACLGWKDGQPIMAEHNEPAPPASESWRDRTSQL